MPNRDLKNNIAADLGFYAVISSNTTTAGQIVDTANYDGGVMFSFAALAYTDGVYTPLLEESDDSGMSGAVTIPAARIIGLASAVVTALGAATTLGAALATLGITWTKRYVRLSLVSTVVTTGATIVAMTHKVPEIKPVV
jgi:hypothetical protein